MWITFGDVRINTSFSLIWAALWGTTLTLPINNIRTRLFKQFDDPSKNRITYNGILDCINKIIVNEGFTAF